MYIEHSGHRNLSGRRRRAIFLLASASAVVFVVGNGLAASDEDVIFRGNANVNEPIRTTGTVYVELGTVNFNIPDAFTGRVVVGGPFWGWLQLNEETRLGSLRIQQEGGVGTAPGKTLSVASGFIDFAGGRLDARLDQATAVHKTGTDEAVLVNLANYPGAILVEEGSLRIEGSAAPEAAGTTPIRIVSPDGADVRLRADVYRDIDLNNARGRGHFGALNADINGTATLYGALHLGDRGSTVSSGPLGGTLRLAGPINGGDLDMVATGIVEIAGNRNAYVGLTRVHGGAVLFLSGSGTLSTTSGVRLERGGRMFFDNRESSVTDRLRDGIALASDRGVIEIIGGAETIGPLSISSASEVRASVVTPGALTVTSISRSPGATLGFSGVPDASAPDRPGRILVSSAPPLNDGILPACSLPGRSLPAGTGSISRRTTPRPASARIRATKPTPPAPRRPPTSRC